MDLKIRKGLEANLPQTLDKDTFYVSTDSKKIRLNDAIWEDSNTIKEQMNVQDFNEVVNINVEQTINAKKQFNKGVSINGKTFIADNIDSGELKVYPQGENTNKGFIIRTANRNESIPTVEILATNNYDSYLYDFPQKTGTVALTSDIEDLSNVVKENEKVTANALNDVNSKLKILQSTNVTYNELKNLYENSKLVVGAQYRITDYITTTVKENTKSANHQFDIIVEAIAPNVLNEEATACLHDGDEYFKNSSLTSWNIKYSLFNDVNRFTWADEVNGKGVVYYMKDEFSNEASYDFKNIQFYKSSDWLTEHHDWKTSVLNTFNGTELWLYTFSYYNSSIGVIDDSLMYYATSPQHYAYSNTIKEYYRASDSKLDLNNIIYVTSSNSPYNNTINYGCNNLIFGDNCYNNTIDVNATNNVIGNNFYLNKVGSGFQNNKIYNTNKNAKIVSNIFLNDCQKNTFPRQFISNICGDNFIGNDFISQTSYANLGLVTNCKFGNNFTYNVGMPYKLANIEVLNNTLVFTQSNNGNWKNIVLNNGKTITTFLQDLGTILGSFKLRLGVNEYGQYFAHDVDTDGVYRLGEFNTFNGAMEAAAVYNIAGNAKITKMLFTSGENNGIIEQFVHSNQSTQEVTWNSGFRMRIITFTDTTRTEVSRISDWYWSKPTELYYDASQRKIALTRFDDGRAWGLSGCFGAVELPLATDSADGLMSKEDKTAISNLSVNNEMVTTLSGTVEELSLQVDENEEIVANALNDLSDGLQNQNDRIQENERVIISALTEVKQEINGLKDNAISQETINIISGDVTTLQTFANDIEYVKEFIYDLGTITNSDQGTAWQNMLKATANLANQQSIGIITFILNDQWDKNKKGIIEQQVGKTQTMQTLKWDNCEAIRYITFADENKTTPQNPNTNFNSVRTMPTELWYKGAEKQLSFRQKGNGSNYIQGLKGEIDFGAINFPSPSSVAYSVVKLDSDYTKTTTDTALSLEGANALYQDLESVKTVLNGETLASKEYVQQEIENVKNIVNENEKVSANALLDLQNKISAILAHLGLENI